MSNSSCPPPFLDAALFPADQGYVDGRMCSPIQLPGSQSGSICCLPCPIQNYTLRAASLEALHVNDIINIIGLGVGAFVLLSFIFLPKKVTFRSSLGVAISVAALAINFCFVFPLSNLQSVQCANEITPADQNSNPVCGFQGSLHVFAGHSLALLVVCRTIYLHCQICWNLHVTRIPLIILNIVGWLIPAILLGVVFGVAQITYTISDHCSIREDWIVALLIIPIIIEIGCAIIVQFATFIYCVNVYLRSLNEPPPPSNDSLNGTTTGTATSVASNSAFSTGSSRYPYRKAMKRIHKVLRLQWRAWTQCFALAFIGSLFAIAYYVLAEKYLALQTSLESGKIPSSDVLDWALCLLENPTNVNACDDKAVAFIPNQTLLLVAEYSISTCWVWVSLIFLRLSFFPEWIRLFQRTFNRVRNPRNSQQSSSSSTRSEFLIHLHTPSKELVNVKTRPIDDFRLHALGIPKAYSPMHVKSESQGPILQDSPPRPARSSTLLRKTKMNVEDILALRRLENNTSRQGGRTYPEGRVMSPENGQEYGWPTYQFGSERNV